MAKVKPARVCAGRKRYPDGVRRCAKFRTLYGAAAKAHRRAMKKGGVSTKKRRKASKASGGKKCAFMGLLMTKNGQRWSCFQKTGRKHVKRHSPNWVMPSVIPASRYRAMKKAAQAQRKAMKAAAKKGGISFDRPLPGMRIPLSREDMRRTAASANPFNPGALVP